MLTKRKNVIIMEPFAMVREIVATIMRKDSNVSIVGLLSNFSAMEILLSLKGADVIFCEGYDHSLSIIESMRFIRMIKKQHPGIDVIIHTEIELPCILVQSNADAIYMKKLGENSCRAPVSQILSSENMTNFVFYKDRKMHYDFQILTDEELDILILFSRGCAIKDIAILTNSQYKRISRKKIIIMRKLKVENNTEFSKLANLISSKFGNYPPL